MACLIVSDPGIRQLHQHNPPSGLVPSYAVLIHFETVDVCRGISAICLTVYESKCLEKLRSKNASCDSVSSDSVIVVFTSKVIILCVPNAFKKQHLLFLILIFILLFLLCNSICDVHLLGYLLTFPITGRT